MVKIVTKFPLTAEQAGLITKGKFWWLRSITEEALVNGFPKIECTQPVSVDLNLPNGSYKMGCGDWEAIDSNGKHCTQSVLFYVAEGKLTYVKRKEELPAFPKTGQPINVGAYTPATAPATTQSTLVQPAQPQIEFVELPGLRHCTKQNQVCPDDYACGFDFEPRDVGDEVCRNCTFGDKLYKEKKH